MYKRAMLICIIIGFFLGGLYFKGLTFKALIGITNIEAFKKEVYATENYYLTNFETGEDLIIEYLENEGYKLMKQNGTTYDFYKDDEKLVLNRDSLFDKYYIWNGVRSITCYE